MICDNLTFLKNLVLGQRGGGEECNLLLLVLFNRVVYTFA